MTVATQAPSGTTDDIPSPATVRPIQLQDLDQLEHLEKELHGSDGFRLFILRQLYDLFHSQWYVAEYRGVVRGYVVVGVGTDGKGPRVVRLANSAGDGCRAQLDAKAAELCAELIAADGVRPALKVDMLRPGIVRPATEKDLAALEILDNKVFITVGYTQEILRMFLELFPELWFVVEQDGRVCGYALSGLEAAGGTTWLLGLAVDELQRGNGLGRILMDQSMGASLVAGATEAKITVRPTNKPAVALYEKFGFRTLGSEDDYFGPEEERAVLCRSLVEDVEK